MGACDFEEHYREPAPVDQAFSALVNDAAWEHGHGGYTGTIAEKGSYVILDAVDTWEQADQIVRDCMDYQSTKQHPRYVDDKWGPANAVEVRGQGWVFFGWASS